MNRILPISIGAILGANARFFLGLWLDQRFGPRFPLGTLVINCSGSFALGFLIVLATERLSVSPEWRLLLTVGFLGSYTTFSTFSVETWALLDDGSGFLGLSNAVLSVGGGVFGAWLGAHLARLI